MKKLLALLLVLTLAMTAVLTSCKKDVDENNDDEGLIDTEEPNGNGGEGTSDPDDGKGNNTPCTTHTDADKNGKCDTCDATVEVKPDPVPAEFQTVNDVIYVLFPANIRQEPSSKSKAIGTVNYTDELVRTGTNGDWNRVEFKGETAYIMADLTTNNKNVITFNTLETPKTVYVNVLEQMNLRTTPCYFEGFENNIGVSGVKRGEELTLIAENAAGDWAKVEYTDKDGKTKAYYCRPGNISETKPSDDPNEDVNDETPVSPAG